MTSFAAPSSPAPPRVAMGEVTAENPHVTSTRDGTKSILVSVVPGGGSPRRRVIVGRRITKKASLHDDSGEDEAESSDVDSTSSSGTSNADSTSDSSAYTSDSESDEDNTTKRKKVTTTKANRTRSITGNKRSFRTPRAKETQVKPPPVKRRTAKRVRFNIPETKQGTDDEMNNDAAAADDEQEEGDDDEGVAANNPWAADEEPNPIQDVHAGRPCTIVFGRRYFTGWSNAQFVFNGMVDAMTAEDVTLSHKDDVVTVDLATGIVDSSNIEALAEDDDTVPWRVREVSSDGKVGQ